MCAWCRPGTPIGDIMEHKYQKCFIQQNIYNLLDRKEEQIATVSGFEPFFFKFRLGLNCFIFVIEYRIDLDHIHKYLSYRDSILISALLIRNSMLAGAAPQTEFTADILLSFN